MMQKLSKKRQQQAAVGILSAIVLLLSASVALPIWSINAAYEARIGQLQTRLLRSQSNALADEALRPKYELLMRSQATTGHHLKSNTPAVAGAELQRIMKGIVSKNSTQIQSTQILPAAEEQGFVRVVLKVRLRGPVEGIVQSLYDIEADPMFLFLDKMSMRSSATRRPRNGNEINQFDTEFDLIAYMPKPL